MSIISETLENLELGEGMVFANLTMFPLLNSEAGERSYLTLDEALSQNVCRVTEVSESGSVPELRFRNDADKPVLLLDGEELVGAKQNRVLNLSILVPAKSEILIPVTCVEQGRWSHQSTEFSSASRAQFSRGRAAKSAQVSESMLQSGNRRSNQGAVWNDIEQKRARMCVQSNTGAMSDIYESRTVQVEKFVDAIKPQPGQVGALFGIDGGIAGFDLFDAGSTLEELLPKLVRSYALDAVETVGDQERVTEREEAQRFLDIVSNADVQAFDAVGLGEDLRLHDEMIAGGALVVDKRVVHLGAFPLGNSSRHATGFRRSRFARSSQRRRSH